MKQKIKKIDLKSIGLDWEGDHLKIVKAINSLIDAQESLEKQLQSLTVSQTYTGGGGEVKVEPKEYDTLA